MAINVIWSTLNKCFADNIKMKNGVSSVDVNFNLNNRDVSRGHNDKHSRNNNLTESVVVSHNNLPPDIQSLIQ
jgi:hypothetical protein